MVKAALALLVLTATCLAQTEGREQTHTYTKQISRSVKLEYLLVLPKGHAGQQGKVPVILYLHGAGDRGTDLNLVRRVAAYKEAESRADYPFLFVAPQLPDPDHAWVDTAYTEAVMGMLDDVLAKYNGDPDRVYLTGISMGGWSAWYYAELYPERFAAIAPLCGFPDVRWAPRLAHVPVWTFHGTSDRVAPIIDTERMVDALQRAGGDPKFTPVIGGDHDIAQAVYSRDDLYAWFLAHRRGAKVDRPADMK